MANILGIRIFHIDTEKLIKNNWLFITIIIIKEYKSDLYYINTVIYKFKLIQQQGNGKQRDKR